MSTERRKQCSSRVPGARRILAFKTEEDSFVWILYLRREWRYTVRLVPVIAPGNAEVSMGKLRHIAVQVPDLEKAATFYEGVFGLKRVNQVDSPFGNAIS